MNKPMTIKFLAIIVILLLLINPTISFANDNADSLFKAKARKDSVVFRMLYRNQNYFTPEFREKMRYYEIRNNLLKNIIMQKIFYLFDYGDSTLKKKENFQAYFSEIIKMGDNLELSEYKLDTCLKVNNSLIYKYSISNLHKIFHKYNWKNTTIENGKNIKHYYIGAPSDSDGPEGIISIDTTEADLNKINFISGNVTLNNNYFDYCQCVPDSNEFVNYLYYKYHRFNDRYDNIHKVRKVTYKINSSFPYYDYRNECDEIYVKYVKFVFVNNKWEDKLLYYLEEIE